ncbi:MAG TPA: hypothetical protein VFI87_01735 [Hyphomicrobiaceae bacterium]|nr:hypothetical protein [Hyphomicrobiaceae bacterium]
MHVLINPPGAVRLYSSPPFWLYVIVAGVPSLLLTVLVCCSGYLGVRAFRQGHAARGAILLVVALVPFLLFTARMVEAALADREHARYIAGVAKIGPVIDYPKVFVVAGSLTEMEAARLMLAARFQEVDAFEYGPKGATYTLASSEECRQRFEAWLAKGAGLEGYYSNVNRCVNATRWEKDSPPKRQSAVALLRGDRATLKRDKKGRENLELHIKDGDTDILVDYSEAPYAKWPIFPLLVTLGGFETRDPQFGPAPVEFILRNLKR